jgi:hypothetical protein
MSNSVNPKTRLGGEAMQAASRIVAGRSQSNPKWRADDQSAGANTIASVVLPFLEKAMTEVRRQGGRLDYGVRKFDVATGQKFSVYFSVVPNATSGSTKVFYIIDLSSHLPLLIVTDSLDVGSGVRRREVSDLNLASHDDITPEILETLIGRACDEARVNRP